MMAPHFPVKATMHLFKASRNAVCKARLHAADVGSGLSPPVVNQERMMVDPQRFAYIHQWTRMVTPVAQIVLRIPRAPRIPAPRYPEHRRLARIEMSNKKPMSRTYLHEHVGDGFVNEKEEACCVVVVLTVGTQSLLSKNSFGIQKLV